MATYKYLDTTGLEQLWSKIKNYVSGLISQPNWDAEEDEDGYVMNRPMWLDLYDTTIFSSEEPTAFVIPSGGSIEVTPIKNYSYNLLHSGGQVTIVTDSGTITSELGYDSTDNYYYCHLDTSDFTLRFTEDKVELVSNLDASDTYNILEIGVPYHEAMVKEEYNSVFQSDWAETNSNLGDYIKNKPPIHAGTGVDSLIIGATSNQVTGDASIANGINNTVSGHCSIVTGDSNLVSQGTYEIINGYDNTTSAPYAVANGQYNKASGSYSLARGNYSEASATHAIAMGTRAKASGNYSLAFGGYIKIGSCALTGDASATTYSTIFSNQSAVDYMKHYGISSYVNDANGKLIRVTKVVDGAAEFEVLITFESTLSDTALSEATYTFYATPIATGVCAISMGLCNTASGQAAVALGSDNVSSGFCGFAEGRWTTASGEASHSENKSTVASGKYTHAQGENTTANGYAETTIGRFNALSNASAQTAYNTTNSPYILVAGNGTADNARSNAYTLDWNGNGWYSGKLTVGANPTADMDVATKKYVDDNVEAIPQPEDDINVLNLLTEFGYSAPVADADNKIITDADNNIVLG